MKKKPSRLMLVPKRVRVRVTHQSFIASELLTPGTVVNKGQEFDVVGFKREKNYAHYIVDINGIRCTLWPPHCDIVQQ